jgi:predicted dehydrogenase
MMCHWRYVLDNLFGQVESVSCLGATHIPQRWDESRPPLRRRPPTTPPTPPSQLEGPGGGVIAQINSSWVTRVRRDDLVTFHVDGTHGSAVAGLQSCRAQPRVTTPRPVWNPDVKQGMNFFEHWQEVPDAEVYDNGFKIVQWEVHPPRRRGRAVPLDAARRGQGRAARRGGAAELARAALDRRAGARSLRPR